MAITPASVEPQGDRPPDEWRSEPRSRDAELGGGTWDEFQAARQRYLSSVGERRPEVDPESLPVER